MNHARPRRVYPAFYLLAMLLGGGLSAALLGWGLADRKVKELVFFFWIPLVPAVVAQCMLIYKSWAAIQDGHASTSPAKAVGLCFVPFFNLYWVFQVWLGFAADYNEYLRRHRLVLPKLSRNTYMGYSILHALMAVPLVNLVAAVPLWLLSITIVQENCRAINQLADATTAVRTKEAPPARRPAALLVAGILLILVGLGAVGLGIAPAMESRRVYKHQRIKQQEHQRRMDELAGRDDLASRQQLEQLRRERWSPEAYLEEFVTWCAIMGGGAVAGLVGAALILVWYLRGPKP